MVIILWGIDTGLSSIPATGLETKFKILLASRAKHQTFIISGTSGCQVRHS